MTVETIKVPDIGGAEGVEVIEICVAVGDEVEKEDSLVVLESDKASMEIPSPSAGTVKSINISDGDTLSEGDVILTLDTDTEQVESFAPPVPDQEAAESSVIQPQSASAPSEATPVAGAVSIETINVPDIGGGENVDVIEVCVNVGDRVESGDSLIVLETDKASMEVPAPKGGKVTSIAIKEGDTASEGTEILQLEVSATDSAPQPAESAAAKVEPTPAEVPVSENSQADTTSTSVSIEAINVPDIGGGESVDVIEVCVSAGDAVDEGDALIVLETDKASMEVPAPSAGKVVSLSIKEGDIASEGTEILQLEVESSGANVPATSSVTPAEAPTPATPPAPVSEPAAPVTRSPATATSEKRKVYAGPAVRLLARELGVDINEVIGTGPRKRIIKDDLKAFVKNAMTSKVATASGSGIPSIPDVDFSKFGEVTLEKMSKIQKITVNNMHRNWLNVPHVTQFDDVDISDLEDFRKTLKADAEQRGVKITPLPFLLKACAAALKEHPKFNASLHSDGEHVVYKHYVNIGMAVDTPAGLVVPVIKDVDKKSVWELAAETVELAAKAKNRKLTPAEMQGAGFTISSLGGIGGRGFTPIVNAPEVAILGISKLDIKPVWNGAEFVPRKILPLSLSYDHRAINGGDAGRFFTYLGSVLADIRLLVL